MNKKIGILLLVAGLISSMSLQVSRAGDVVELFEYAFLNPVKQKARALAGKKDLDEHNLSRITLYNRNFQSASLRRANLRNSNLRKTNFRKAKFGHLSAYGVGADFTGAKLEGTDFREADMSRVTLKKVTVNAQTDFRGVIGLTEKQKERLRNMGAKVD